MRLIPLALIALAACTPDPGPSFHLIEPPEPITAGTPAGPAIGLREIALPLYARRPQMAVQGAGGAVTLNDNQRWAEEPPRALTRLLARMLGARTGRVFAVEPWSIDIDPRVLVQIETDTLIGSLDGALRFEGSVRFIDRRNGSVRVEPFSFSESVGASHADLAAAHGRVLSQLADLIARGLS